MRILFLPVHPGLAPWVHSLWFFESPEGLPPDDRRLIVPNGRSKFILTLEGPLVLEDGLETTLFPPGRALFIGPWDRPVALSSPGRTRTLGLELTPAGAQRFFDLPLVELQNQVVNLVDLWPLERDTLAWLLDLSELTDVSQGFQELLLSRRYETPRARTIDFAVTELLRRSGLVGIRELEIRTGYTRRTLDTLFLKQVGLSPKTLATIIRFQRVYRLWAQKGRPDFYAELDQDLYFDQSHLIREFKRFTGFAPARYARESNQFGKLFYTNPNFSHLSNS